MRTPSIAEVREKQQADAEAKRHASNLQGHVAMAGGAYGRDGEDSPPTAMRDPTWDECSIEDKIERLREHARHMREMWTAISSVRDEVQTLINMLQEHQHSAAGVPVIPLGIVPKYSNRYYERDSAKCAHDPLA